MVGLIGWLYISGVMNNGLRVPGCTLLYLLAAVLKSSAAVCYFPGIHGNYTLVSQNNSRVKESLKNHCPENSSPWRVNQRRHYSLVDVERFVTSSANVPVELKCLVVKQKEGDFAKVTPFLTEKAITDCARSVSTGSVSYTHLDVYKRQSQHHKAT